jgi:starch synthase
LEDVEEQFKLLKKKFPDHLGLFIGYKEDLSHKIYAGADFLLMPSRVEPCGLNQLYALAYGCMPIVRRIGGLQDTVIDINDEGLGICHDEASVEDIACSIGRALEIYNNKRRFSQIQKRMMQVDHSWEHSAKQYASIYQTLTG